MGAKFWVRFQIPYFNYLELLQWIGDNTRFAHWCGVKSNNKMSSLIELLVLGSLHYLGCGWTFDNIKEQTAISKEVHWSLYSLFVLAPLHLPEVWSNM